MKNCHYVVQQQDSCLSLSMESIVRISFLSPNNFCLTFFTLLNIQNVKNASFILLLREQSSQLKEERCYHFVYFNKPQNIIQINSDYMEKQNELKTGLTVKATTKDQHFLDTLVLNTLTVPNYRLPIVPSSNHQPVLLVVLDGGGSIMTRSKHAWQ